MMAFSKASVIKHIKAIVSYREAELAEAMDAVDNENILKC